MPQSLCNFPTNTGPQTSLLLQPDALMAQYPPVEVGTRGTVGSLLMQEIEYFRRIESNNSRDRTGKNKSKMKDMGCSGSTSCRASIVSTAACAKKKQGSSKLLPSMCSMVDVSDISRPNGSGTSAFSYRNLKSDTKSSKV